MNKSMYQYSRRNFLQIVASSLGAVATGCSVTPLLTSNSGIFHSLANIGKLLPPDDNGVMLPEGFKSRIVARTGEAPITSSDYLWHQEPDGGAVFATNDGGWVYVSNCEVLNKKGGVGALRFNAQGEVIDAYPILENTSNNCAGGKTPWGTWLSCEEVPNGQVYECDPMGKNPAVLRPALGTFNHEAVAVDTNNQCVYMTEDMPDGGFYRFRSTRGLPDLNEGTLEIAAVKFKNEVPVIEWLTVPDPLGRELPTRMQVPGYTGFAGGEGIDIFQNKVYFVTKYDNRVWCYNTVNQQLEIIYDIKTSENPILKGVDNLIVIPSGEILVAEDGGDMQIVILTPDRQVKPLLQVTGHVRSEITGPAFDPLYQRLYFSSQRGTSGPDTGGITYEISFKGNS